MPSQDDRFWGDVAGKIRRALFLRPLTKKEAEQEYEAADAMPLSDGEIDSIVESVVNGAVNVTAADAQPEWLSDSDCQDLESQVLQLNRNKREDKNNGVDELVEQHRREAFSDNEQEHDKDGLEDSDQST